MVEIQFEQYMIANHTEKRSHRAVAAPRAPPSLPRTLAAMPASAGRVRMPAGNRIHSSAALATHGIWSQHIGDSYAPDAAAGGGGGGDGGGGGGAGASSVGAGGGLW